jgi:hypothetical protein
MNEIVQGNEAEACQNMACVPLPQGSRMVHVISWLGTSVKMERTFRYLIQIDNDDKGKGLLYIELLAGLF